VPQCLPPSRPPALYHRCSCSYTPSKLHNHRPRHDRPRREDDDEDDDDDAEEEEE